MVLIIFLLNICLWFPELASEKKQREGIDITFFLAFPRVGIPATPTDVCRFRNFKNSSIEKLSSTTFFISTDAEIWQVSHDPVLDSAHKF